MQLPPSKAKIGVSICKTLDGMCGRSEEGDQQRFWKLTRRFIEDLAQAYPGEAPRVRAVSRHVPASSPEALRGHNQLHATLFSLLWCFLHLKLGR